MTKTKTALVTAAAGVGIGSAIASQLAADGMRVVVTDAHERRCQEYAERIAGETGAEVIGMHLDVTDAKRVETVMNEVAERFGSLDVLVNNAGFNKIEPVSEMSLETWHKSLDIDLNGTFYAMRFALPHMIRQGSGNIINISSIGAWECSVEHGSAYAAAKAAVMALTRVAAAENGKHGIRVNAVAPGLIYNDFLRKIYPKEFFDGYAQDRSFVGRVGEPQDVANLVSFLASDKAGYITGETYGISGGVFPHA
ncbi:MAG: SDR family oxidoreductase [Rhodobacteraceae bacterium]|nr:SDR family oxidoreductase [Paracoccaceae bacterium]